MQKLTVINANDACKTWTILPGSLRPPELLMALLFNFIVYRIVMVRKKAIRACWKTRPPVTTCRPSFAVFALWLSESKPPPIWTMKDLILSDLSTSGLRDSHNIKADKHLAHPTPPDSENLVLGQKCLGQSSQDHIVESVDRQRRKQDEKERCIVRCFMGWFPR